MQLEIDASNMTAFTRYWSLKVSNEPALFLLLSTGLLQFWLMPGFAWALLYQQRDQASRLWFGGTVSYAIAVSLVVIQNFLPNLVSVITGQTLAVLMVILFCASMRIELKKSPVQPRLIASLLITIVVLYVLIEKAFSLSAMRLWHISLISVLDLVLCNLIYLVIRRTKSLSLRFVLASLSLVVITNLLRIYAYIANQELPSLFNYTWTSNLAFIVNYLSVVVYCFGYWGFVIEKTRSHLSSEVIERGRAQIGESQALDRERMLQELLDQQNQLIEKLSKAQQAAQAGAVSASIAHEVNQPLASLRLLLDEATDLRKNVDDPKRLNELLAIASSESKRAANIIRRVSNVFANRMIEPESRNIDDIVSESCDLVIRRANSLQIKITTELKAPYKAVIGAGEFEHVVLNLLSNAIDALSESQTHDAKIVVTTIKSDGYILLGMRDNGPGISDELRSRLFELFQGSQRGGSGLGLWLSRHILERHGGSIEIAPQDDKTPGAFFKAKLRLA